MVKLTLSNRIVTAEYNGKVIGQKYKTKKMAETMYKSIKENLKRTKMI